MSDDKNPFSTDTLNRLFDAAVADAATVEAEMSVAEAEESWYGQYDRVKAYYDFSLYRVAKAKAADWRADGCQRVKDMIMQCGGEE